MKREIKFRVWDKDSKQMDLAVRLEVDDSGHIDTAEGYGDVYHNFELMEYTGLRDKNGREIYEGDVVKNEYGKVMEVQYDPRSAAFGVGGYYFGTIGSGKILEVIGNIYEDGGLGDNKNSTTN